MRIKKVSQTTPIPATVVNVKSNSQTNTYSCDYINDLNTYSTTEQRIGTFSDGKPVYRKTLIANITNTNTVNVALDITNQDKVWINCGLGFFMKDDKSISMPLIYYYDSSNYVRTYISGTNAQIKIGASSWAPGTAYIVVEYTKTTD